MLLLYDWKKIYRASKGRSSECVRIFKYLTSKNLPRNRSDPNYKYVDRDFSGGSFLVRPDLLAYNAFRYTSKEICAYLLLASLRNLGDFVVYHKTSLDCFHSVLSPELYNQNRLLHIKDEQIHFLYEEVPTEKQKWQYHSASKKARLKNHQ